MTSALLPARADYAAIGLEELTAFAAFTTRVDRKYVLDARAAAEFLGRLPEGTRVLEIGGRRSFGYRSVYFDDARLTSFHDTATRRRRRAKVRTREYLDSGACWVEVKTRRGPVTCKERIARPGLDAEALAFVAGQLADSGSATDAGQLRPVLTTTYRRATYVLPAGAARLTVDTGLIWALPGGRHLGPPGTFIVETKGTVRPSAADRTLWALGHRPIALSKFATGLAALTPGLSRHRWHRLLASPVFTTDHHTARTAP